VAVFIVNASIIKLSFHCWKLVTKKIKIISFKIVWLWLIYKIQCLADRNCWKTSWYKYYTLLMVTSWSRSIKVVANFTTCDLPTDAYCNCLNVDHVHRLFTVRRYAKRGICRRCVCVCVSVTLQYCIKTDKRRITQIMPHHSPETLVFWQQSSRRNSNGITPPIGATNAGEVGSL